MNKKKTQVPNIRSSAAEYLTFVAAGGNSDVNVVFANDTLWLSQKMMALLYDIDVRTINYHLKTIFRENELQEDSVIQNFRITARIWLDLMLKKHACCVDWSKINKNKYMEAMRLSVTDDSTLKKWIGNALTDKIHDREMFMKGIDYSYYYEEAE